MHTITRTHTGITLDPDLETTLRELAQIGYLAEQQPCLQTFLDLDLDLDLDTNTATDTETTPHD